jgi:lipoprotein-anchoring transpeptidase ErfK/SrfK
VAYSIIVNLSARQLILYRGGSAVRFFPIGIGRMVTPTPIGRYYIISKIANPGGVFGAMWMGLNKPHYGIHGTNNPSSIGKVVSHGCIRMYNHDVLELSQFITIGTTVRIV